MPRFPSIMHVSCSSFLTVPPQFNRYFENTHFWFNSTPLAIFFFSIKVPPFEIYDDVMLHVICGLAPLPIKNPRYTNARKRNFFAWLFSFQPIKNNAVFKPRTGQDWTFSRTGKVRAKAKDLRFEAKDFKMYQRKRSQGQECPRELRL